MFQTNCFDGILGDNSWINLYNFIHKNIFESAHCFAIENFHLVFVLNPFSLDTWKPLQQVVYLHENREQEWGVSIVYLEDSGEQSLVTNSP